jgi:hypothetical protein
MRQLLSIKQGDSDIFTDTISGLTSLSGYTGKMYIYNAAGVLSLTLTGVMDGLKMVYEILNEQTKVMPLGLYPFEAKTYDSADHVYTTTTGILIIDPAKNNDPS